MRRAGFLGHHPQRDKEHQLASRKCRRESTPQTRAPPACAVAIGVLAPTPYLRRRGAAAVVRSQISGWRDHALYPLARAAAEGAANPAGGDFCFGFLFWRSVDGIEGGAGAELPGRLAPAAARDLSGRFCGVCSLSNFRLAEGRALSLGAAGSRWRGESGDGDFCFGFLFWRSVMASRAAPAVSYRDGSSQRPLATSAGGARDQRALYPLAGRRQPPLGSIPPA
jgi:hypothetical protein